MKSDQQFIEDMWIQVDQMELEALEHERALKVSKSLFWKEACILLVLGIVTGLIILSFYVIGSDAIYLEAILLIIMAYVVDSYVISRG